MSSLIEPEVSTGRRAFATAQALLAGSVIQGSAVSVPCGWHGTETDPEVGSFAVVKQDGLLTALVGEIVKVTYRSVVVYAYVLGERDVPVELSLSRRAMMPLALLAEESIVATVETVL